LGRTSRAVRAALAVGVLLVAGCGGGAAKKPAVVWKYGDIHFGVLAPLSGGEAARGRDLVDGARLAAEDLNVRGGVLGKRVRVDALDDGCDAARPARARSPGRGRRRSRRRACPPAPACPAPRRAG